MYGLFFPPIIFKLFILLSPNKTPEVGKAAIITTREVKKVFWITQPGSGNPHPCKLPHPMLFYRAGI